MKNASRHSYGRKKQDRREAPTQKALQLATLGATPPPPTTIPAEKSSNTN